MSKLAASTGLLCAFCIIPVLVIISLALLVFTPGGGRAGANRNPVAEASQAPTQASRARVQAAYTALPLAFELNQGQTDDQAKYVARGDGYTLFLTANDAVFSLHSPSGPGQDSAVSRATAFFGKHSSKHASKGTDAVVRMQLVGGSSSANLAASDQLSGTSNYFLGNDPSKWRRDIPSYARVAYENVYPGVNMAFHGAQRQLEFDFLVAPRANAQPIDFQFTGAKSLKVDNSGNLVVSSGVGDVVLHKPVAYQQQDGARKSVDARFALKANNQVGFELGTYDHSRELIIDPSVTLAYATYLGGSAEDDGYGIAFDSSGNGYVTGKTKSVDFPIVGGISGASTGAFFDVFVTKIAASGAGPLIYSTYVGGGSVGKGDDSGNAIAVDASGDAFVAGGTTSSDFPLTMGGGEFQSSLNGSSDAFVFELSSAGGALTYSTYLGGSGGETALGIALASDSSGDVFVVGTTSSQDFPTTPNPLQGYVAGSTNSAFVTKMNSSGSALVYSTYLGGSTTLIGDSAAAVAVDSSDNAYVTGATYSATFPFSTGAFQTTCKSCAGGLPNAFVTVFNSGGTAHVYSTFLGGTGPDVGDGIAVDAAGNAYVTGTTGSTAFPTTTGALQTTYGGSTDAFVTKLNPAGSSLVYSTFLGGGGFDAGASIAVDGSGDAYVTGQTASTTPTAFPTSTNATQSTLGGGTDAFVSEINAPGSKLIFSTYLGGIGNEDTSGNYGSIAVDAPGANIYVTGNTTSSTNFTTLGAAYTTYGGGTDAFIAKYSQQAFNITATTPTAVSAGSNATSTVTLTAFNGYASSVKLTCAVAGTGTPLPTCSIGSPVTPTTAGATTTLNIMTTAAGGTHSKAIHLFPAIWLPIVGLSLAGIGVSSSRVRRKQLFGFVMTGIAISALILLPACGGGSSGGDGGGTCAAAPTVPTGLAATSTTSTGTTLNWTASTAGANCTVTGYTVDQNGRSIGTPTTTTLAVTGLTAATAYNFTVAATDSAGTSAQSTALAVTTLAAATPAGNYTITITGVGTDAAATTRTAQLVLTVN